MSMRKTSRTKPLLLHKPIVKKKKVKKTKKNNKKIARTRRQRGYHWEDTIVKRFNALSGWKAFRLGSPSVALPDVLAISTEDSTIFTIEAKSGTSNSLQVPFDQIHRCIKWTETFELYKKRKVVLAFKFLSKKRIDIGEYESRELREFFKIWDVSLDITDCVCTYEGDIYALSNGKRSEILLKDYPMPFNSKYQVFSKS